MGKVVPFIFALILSASALGQEAISSYMMSYFENPSYEVSAVQEDDDYEYFIDMYSLAGENRPVVLMVEKPEDLASLISNMEQARDKYAEWDSISVANNVTDLEKEMSIKPKNLKCAFTYGDWNFDYSVRLTYRFKHIDGAPLLIISTGELNSYSNQYIDSKGGVFVFSSVDEINEFVNALDRKNAEKYFNRKTNTESLFED